MYFQSRRLVVFFIPLNKKCVCSMKCNTPPCSWCLIIIVYSLEQRAHCQVSWRIHSMKFNVYRHRKCFEYTNYIAIYKLCKIFLRSNKNIAEKGRSDIPVGQKGRKRLSGTGPNVGGIPTWYDIIWHILDVWVYYIVCFCVSDQGTTG